MQCGQRFAPAGMLDRQNGQSFIAGAGAGKTTLVDTAAGRLLGVSVHDLVIVGREGHISLRAQGLV